MSGGVSGGVSDGVGGLVVGGWWGAGHLTHYHVLHVNINVTH